MSSGVAFRSKIVCLLDQDIQAFSLLLQEEYPAARYFASPSWNSPAIRGSIPPDLTLYSSLAEIEDALRPFDLHMTMDDRWSPSFSWRERLGCWSLDYPALPTVRFLRGRVWPVRDGRPENLRPTNIDVSCRPDNKDDFAFARRLFRLLGKVASNRDQLAVWCPSYEVIRTCEKGSELMIGHAARQWALEDSRRLLWMGDLGDWGYRPMAGGLDS